MKTKFVMIAISTIISTSAFAESVYGVGFGPTNQIACKRAAMNATNSATQYCLANYGSSAQVLQYGQCIKREDSAGKKTMGIEIEYRCY